MADAAGSSLKYYLSLDGTLSSNAIPLSPTVTIPPLAAGASFNTLVEVQIPPNTTPGIYFALACADAGQAVPESNESNNCIASTDTITVITCPVEGVPTVRDPEAMRFNDYAHAHNGVVPPDSLIAPAVDPVFDIKAPFRFQLTVSRKPLVVIGS
jgi:hypothetical protein